MFRFNLTSVSAGVGLVVLVLVVELADIVHRLPPGASLGSTALASMMVNVQNAVLLVVAFVVGVVIANRLRH
jgi:hypothetical protein